MMKTIQVHGSAVQRFNGCLPAQQQAGKSMKTNVQGSMFAILYLLTSIFTSALAQTGTLTYPLKDNLDLRHGTLECWVQFGIEVSEQLPVKEDFKTFFVLFEFQGDKAGMAASYFGGSIYGRDKAGWYFRPSPKPLMLPIGSVVAWKKGEWHHVAFTWKEKLMRLYLDGKQTGERDQQATFADTLGTITDQVIMFGDKWNVGARLAIDDVRISSIARAPEELGFAVGKLKPDPDTMLLDPFECDFAPDGKARTTPSVILNGEGGLPTKPCAFVEGKFGKAISLFKPE